MTSQVRFEVADEVDNDPNEKMRADARKRSSEAWKAPLSASAQTTEPVEPQAVDAQTDSSDGQSSKDATTPDYGKLVLATGEGASKTKEEIDEAFKKQRAINEKIQADALKREADAWKTPLMASKTTPQAVALEESLRRKGEEWKTPLMATNDGTGRLT